MEIILPVYLTGLLTSILIEIIKFFPAIGEDDLRKSLVAIILVALGASITVGWSWGNFFMVMLYAFANYKMIIQPVAKKLGLPSQPK